MVKLHDNYMLKMKTMKKTYITPAMLTIKIQHQSHLLTGTNNPNNLNGQNIQMRNGSTIGNEDDVW